MREVNLKILGMDCAACVARLDESILKEKGVQAVAVNYAAACARIQYDEEQTDLAHLAMRVKKTGYQVPLEQTDLCCRNLQEKYPEAEKYLQSVFGVKETEADFASGTLTVTCWPVQVEARQLLDACRSAGLEAEVAEIRGGEEEQQLQKRIRLLRALVAAAILTVPLMWEIAPKIQFLFGTAIALGPAMVFYRGALRGIRNKSLGMDFLVAASTTILYLYSTYIAFTVTGYVKLYYSAQGVLVSLILFGKYLEATAESETSGAIRKLLRLQPKTAMVEKDGRWQETDIDDIQQHDVVLVRPGERIPVDGIILEGQCAVDESMLTGESMPVDHSAGDHVIGGSLNRDGTVRIAAENLGKQSTLSRIVEIVRRAQNSKAPIQRFADRIASWFVPAVVLIAAAVFAAWYFWVRPGEFPPAMLACCDVLAIACPCALGLATPTSLMVGSGRAAELGILFRGGEELEKACEATTVIFDKTGTLTEGKPEVTDVLCVKGTPEDLVRLAAGLEYRSDHPLARAITEYAAGLGEGVLPPHAEQVRYIAGRGLQGTVDGRSTLCGSREFLAENGIDIEPLRKMRDLRREAKSEICLAQEGTLQGVFGVADRLKPGVPAMIRNLEEQGYTVGMLTGDSRETAEAIGAQAGISPEHIYWQVLPAEKEEKVEELKKRGVRVCMVGDGINDTPTLAAADVSVAMGTGSEIAVEAAGILLASGNVEKLPDVFQLSQITMRNVRQNITWAFCYNLIGIPAAAIGILHPSICATLMSLSSIGVLMHALKLRHALEKSKTGGNRNAG